MVGWRPPALEPPIGLPPRCRDRAAQRSVALVGAYPIARTGAAARPGYRPGMAVHSRTAGVGSRAPDFTLTDQDAQQFHLEEALRGGPVVLVFLRGFG